MEIQTMTSSMPTGQRFHRTLTKKQSSISLEKHVSKFLPQVSWVKIAWPLVLGQYRRQETLSEETFCAYLQSWDAQIISSSLSKIYVRTRY